MRDLNQSSVRVMRLQGLAVLLAIGAHATIVDAQQAVTSFEPRTIAVEINNFAFTPALIEARAGDIIEFTNADFVPHTATTDTAGWDTGPIAFEAKTRIVVRGSGEVPFHCLYHPIMRATVMIRTPG